MYKFLSLLFLITLPNITHANQFQKDCNDVGNYIHDHANEVFNALYVSYNGIGLRKKNIYEKNYQSFAWKYMDYGYGIDERFKNYQKNYSTALKNLVKSEESEKKRFDEKLIKTSFRNYKKEEFGFLALFSGYYCRRLIGKNVSTCKKNLKKIVKLIDRQQIRPYEGAGVTSLTLPNIVRSTLTSPEIVETLYRVNSELIPKAKEGNYIYKRGNVKDLLVSKASSVIKDKNRADDLAWDILATYSTRGASLEGYSINLVSEKTAFSFSQIYEFSNLMHAFDSTKITGENLFSLPLFKKNSCVFGKAYHFWMMAYLSRYLHKQGVSKLDAFYASAAMGVMYDFYGSGSSQRANTKIYEKSLKSIYTKSIHHSLLFKILGAFYGVAAGQLESVDVDSLYSLINNEISDKKRKVYKGQLTFMYNLPHFLQRTAVDKVIQRLSKHIP